MSSPAATAATMAASATSALHDDAKGAVATVYKDFMSDRHTADIKPDTPHSQEAQAYRDKLSNVDATTRTADNIMTVFGDPKKVLGIIMTVLLIVWLLSKFGDKIADFISSLISPVSHAFDVHRAENLTGTPATIDNSQAAAIADAIDACILPNGDDEQGIYAQLRSLNTPADWQAVCNAFGTRQCRKKVLGITTHNEKHDLRAMLTCNLTDKELAQIRTILANIGVAF